MFLLTLRFMAARYWLPFLPPVILAALSHRPSRRLVVAAVGIQAAVGIGCAVDDLLQARSEAALANAAILAAPGPGRFAGHWGWQHVLESNGWTPIEDGAPLAPGTVLASAANPWPQEPAEGTDVTLLWTGEVAGTPFLPRIHTARGGANIHAHLVSGRPPVETYAPWTFTDDVRERAWVAITDLRP